MGYRTAELPPVDLDEFATIPFFPRMKILMLHWVEEGFGTPKQTATFYAWKIFFYGLFGLIVAGRIGEKNAFEIRGPHGGVHPHAILSREQCPDDDYREFVASFHTDAVHMHLGQAGRSASFPFNLHTAAEARGATFKAGSHVLHDRGRLAVTNDPRVKAVAARYAGRPGLQ